VSVTRADIYTTFPEFDLSRSVDVDSVDTVGDILTTVASHGLVAGAIVQFTNVGGSLPGGLAAGISYYVLSTSLTLVDFKVSATFGGAAIDLTSSGSGQTSVVAINPKQDALIDAKLAEAQGQVDYSLFENAVNADTCTKYLTARFVALSPAGLNMKLSEKDGATIYDDTYYRLARAAAFGFRVP
jgi:hypothetical protein